MIIRTPGHLQAHDTRVDLPIGLRVPIKMSANSNLKREGERIKHSLSMPLRTVLALMLGHRVHKHGLITSVQPTRWERA